MSAPQTNQPNALARQLPLYAATVVLLGWLLLIGVRGTYADLTCEVYPVTGTVLVEGRVPDGAVVKFHRVDADQWVATTPTGKVNNEGRFEIQSIGNRNGAPAGEYIVTVEWTPRKVGLEGLETGSNLLPGRYAAANTSPLRATVRVGENELSMMELSCRCTEALAAQ